MTRSEFLDWIFNSIYSLRQKFREREFDEFKRHSDDLTLCSDPFLANDESFPGILRVNAPTSPEAG